jgi:hypothetical protein
MNFVQVVRSVLEHVDELAKHEVNNCKVNYELSFTNFVL